MCTKLELELTGAAWTIQEKFPFCTIVDVHGSRKNKIISDADKNLDTALTLHLTS